eukprot:jgi/Ulvmu1/4759/UM020_0044.1
MGRKRIGHRQSLGDQLENPQLHGVRVYPHKKKLRKSEEQADDAEEVDAGQSSKILALAKDQQQEVSREAEQAPGAEGTGALSTAIQSLGQKRATDFDDNSELDEEEEIQDIFVDDIDGFNSADEETFNAFMQNDSTQGGSLLADVIMAKLQSRAPAPATEENQPEQETGMTEEMVEVYQDVGKLLSRYTAGKLPKAFKVIPHLRNWEEVLFMTSPQTWSPHATLAATKMFMSQLHAKQAQRFLNLVLLNVVRDDIREHRRLHFALFQAVKKAVFKPGAFYKGFILPLLKQGDCTLREAVILSAVLNRVSIPMDHSAAALMRMADLPYSGVTSFMIKTLLDKKYALPYRVVDALVDHFMGFRAEDRLLPVIWHLCLLTFVQRYKHDIRAEDKESLRQLLKVQSHHAVTPEIYRELNHGHSRGGQAEGATAKSSARRNVPSGNSEHFRNMAPVIVDEMQY